MNELYCARRATGDWTTLARLYRQPCCGMGTRPASTFISGHNEPVHIKILRDLCPLHCASRAKGDGRLGTGPLFPSYTVNTAVAWVQDQIARPLATVHIEVLRGGLRNTPDGLSCRDFELRPCRFSGAKSSCRKFNRWTAGLLEWQCDVLP
jgi:hypothetical protein